jgi:hypothetical protein
MRFDKTVAGFVAFSIAAAVVVGTCVVNEISLNVLDDAVEEDEFKVVVGAVVDVTFSSP